MSISVGRHLRIAITLGLVTCNVWVWLLSPLRGSSLGTADNLQPAPASVVELFQAVARPANGQQIPIDYEKKALDAILEFDKAAGELPALQRVTALETALASVLRVSLGARERPLNDVNQWSAIQTDLDRKLLEVRRRLLRERTAAALTAADWQHVLQVGDQMAAAYPGDAAMLRDVARLRTRYAAHVLLHNAGKDDPVVRRQLEWVDDHLPEPPRPDPWETFGDALMQAGQPVTLFLHADADALRQTLIRKAAVLLAEARQTADNKKAIPLLQAALEIWPRLPGLRDELLKRQGQYAILNVGVRTLPEYLSPARAAADSELQALELLFEGLLQTRPADDGGLIYAPQLAARLPHAGNSERQVLLKKTTYWSSGQRVTSADVHHTFDLLTSPKLPGHSAELADQIEPLRAVEDAFRLDVKYRQGLLDPLAPLTFKVLPREFAGNPLSSADSDVFAKAPVGSGPYVRAGTLTEQGRTYVRFVVNPYYQGRAAAGPAIREIRFFVCRDPAADFANKIAPLHLLLDLPTQDLAKLKAAGIRDLRTLPTRRVCFLAVNQRDRQLADDALRRALAHGVDRNKLLTDCFRGEADQAVHHALNGPFPAGSWASCPDNNRVPADLFDRARAETFLKAAKGEGGAFDLELKYPDDDPRVEQACKEMAAQLADLGQAVDRPITLRLVALPPHQLKRDVEQRKYQLAYWRHDFPSDSYSLWPLFDPREEALTSGSNFLGFKDDGTLAELLQKSRSYRDFGKVRALSHEIHTVLFERMPLIPLWQLDYHIAVHPRLRMPRVDPLRVFAEVEEWQLAF